MKLRQIDCPDAILFEFKQPVGMGEWLRTLA